MRVGSKLFCSAFVVLATVYPGLLSAQTKERAPIPIQIVAAKKIFISNAGSDAVALPAFDRLGQADLPYSRFYSEIKSWGKYELVATPADADLVFEVHFATPIRDCDKLTTYSPAFQISIFDVKTHFLLWRLSAPVEGAYRKATFEKNIDHGIANLMVDLKALVAQPSQAVAADVR